MRKLLLPWLAAALAGACVVSEPGPNAGGQAYFKALNCRSCHKIGDEGAGRGGPDLTMVGFCKNRAWLDLFLKDPQAWTPGTLMPNPHLSQAARAKLVDYLSSLKGQAWGSRRPWDDPELLGRPVERGRLLFSRAGCASCHGQAGLGGYPNNNTIGGKIPALVSVSQTHTKAELKKKISRGSISQKADPRGPDPLIGMPPWGDLLRDDELDAVVEYLWTLKPASGQSSDW